MVVFTHSSFWITIKWRIGEIYVPVVEHISFCIWDGDELWIYIFFFEGQLKILVITRHARRLCDSCSVLEQSRHHCLGWNYCDCTAYFELLIIIVWVLAVYNRSKRNFNCNTCVQYGHIYLAWGSSLGIYLIHLLLCVFLDIDVILPLA